MCLGQRAFGGHSRIYIKKNGLIINGKNTILMNLDIFTPADNEKLLKDFWLEKRYKLLAL